MIYYMKRTNEALDPEIKAFNKEMRQITRNILNNAKVKNMQTRIFKDDGAWGPFKEFIKAIKDSDPRIEDVQFWDKGANGGYRWQDGNMKDKMREIRVYTDKGYVEGEVICFGAGSVEDPLDAYDMTLQLYNDFIPSFIRA